MQKDMVLSRVPFTASELPGVDFSHIQNLTDTKGIIRQAPFSLPGRKEGYYIEDNSRALLLSVWAGKSGKNKVAQRLLPIYLSFIQSMQMSDGYFRDFAVHPKNGAEGWSIDRDGNPDSGMDERCSEESFGRTMMALGFLVNEGPTHLLIRTGMAVLVKAYEHSGRLVSLRGIANALVGICQIIKYNYPDDAKQDMVVRLSDKLTDMYELHQRDDWQWFEPEMACDNAVLPLALLNAYEITQQEKYMDVAFGSMKFLESKVIHNGVVKPMGKPGVFKPGKGAVRLDQQGMDVMAMVLFYQQAYRITREQEYLDRMYLCYRWFLGANGTGVSLYDPSTGGCADALNAKGALSNPGVESTLAYWISHVTVSTALTE
jgi:hypothetical protein